MKIEFAKNKIPEIATDLLSKIIKIKKDKAKVVALSGDLGVGKTTLTQEIGKQLGIKENIISPTFVVMKIYRLENKSKYYPYFKKLIHIDAYRLDGADELLKLGWNEMSKEKDNLILVEWPEKVEGCIGKDACFVKLNHTDNNTRLVEF